VVLPLIQVYNALGVLMMSYFARNRDRLDFNRILLRTAGAFCVGSILMAAAAVTLGGKIFDHLYAGKYDLRFTLLLPLGIVSVLFALKTVSDSVLRALENVSAMTAVAVVGAIAALAVGVPLALRFGIPGAVYGDLSVYCVTTTAVSIVWIRRLRSKRVLSDSVAFEPGTGSAPCSDVIVPEGALESCTESRG
jgi:O-antigen/teichoic acid export membrane protein